MVNYSAEHIVFLYQKCGSMQYAGEPVSQIEHAWQCARHAARAGASKALQLSAWLHDVGHLIVGLEGSPTVDGVNDEHETIGAQVLSTIWGEQVAQPVRLHVMAKRFLVTTKPEYRKKLSDDSIRSLALQGGLMNPLEIDAFQKNPYSKEAILIRVWDDQSKAADRPNQLDLNQQLVALRELMQAINLNE